MRTANDELVSLDEARRNLIPLRSDGRPVNPSTTWRWIRDGLAGIDDERIRLDVLYCGSRPYVTRAALDEFFARVTTARLAKQLKSTASATDATREELESAGLG